MTVTSLYILEVVNHPVDKNHQRLRDSHQYRTRNNTNFFAMPIQHTSLYEKKSSYAGAKLFNLLPEQLKRIREDKTFKKHLMEWLLEHTSYTLEEFINWRATRLISLGFFNFTYIVIKINYI
ncbi:hypothetical protein J6590_049164 [Homalodisca vitripennis]|nr:hypothetical protein J6590_049164 [Homalodisca vitripennis]